MNQPLQILSSRPRQINMAAYTPATYALGKGLRSAVWVQGCPLHCKGCTAPEFIPFTRATLISPEHMADLLLTQPVEGITLSGGEPFMQAGLLAEMVSIARSRREISVICYTGFQLEILQRFDTHSGVPSLLSQIDCLIDSPYIERLNDNRGLRGSSNQRIFHFTDRLKDYDFQTGPRKVEIHVFNGEVLSVGVPPMQVTQANGILKQHVLELNYVRP